MNISLLGKWLKNAFTYDFRVYTILEVREAMKEAGFVDSFVWWTETHDQKSSSREDEFSDEEKENSADDLHQNDGVYYYEKISAGQKIDGVFAWNAYVVGVM